MNLQEREVKTWKRGNKEKKKGKKGRKSKGKGKKNRKIRRKGKSKRMKINNFRRSGRYSVSFITSKSVSTFKFRPDQDSGKSEGDRLEGASIYPTDLNTAGPTSALHPWLCSLRTRGFRGRHRCGVTLLSGPTLESPSDPFVLVGTAHCNYICKDRLTGDPLETCCCRPDDNQSSCKTVCRIVG